MQQIAKKTGLGTFIDSTTPLPPVPLDGQAAYKQQAVAMTAEVNQVLAAHPRIDQLIGHNPSQLMFDNHRNHATFMVTVFAMGDYRLLARNLLWLYRTYQRHHFSAEYFLLEVKAWIAAVRKFMGPAEREEILEVYDWILNQHEELVQLAQCQPEAPEAVSEDWRERKNLFRDAALNGDHQRCLDIAQAAVTSSADILDFYQQIIQPVLYEVGTLWEQNRISVAHEHLASAIASRVMAAINLRPRQKTTFCGKAVVAATPNEFHEIGAMMVADILEHDGWQVVYLGADVPQGDLLAQLREFKPNLLALSITAPCNLHKARMIIDAMRKDPQLKEIKVLVGGRAVNENSDIWQRLGADGQAANLTSLKEVVSRWKSV